MLHVDIRSYVYPHHLLDGASDYNFTIKFLKNDLNLFSRMEFTCHVREQSF